MGAGAVAAGDRVPWFHRSANSALTYFNLYALSSSTGKPMGTTCTLRRTNSIIKEGYGLSCLYPTPPRSYLNLTYHKFRESANPRAGDGSKDSPRVELPTHRPRFDRSLAPGAPPSVLLRRRRRAGCCYVIAGYLSTHARNRSVPHCKELCAQYKRDDDVVCLASASTEGIIGLLLFRPF